MQLNAVTGTTSLAVGSVGVAENALENAGSDPNICFSQNSSGNQPPKEGAKTVDDILEDATPGRKTKGKTTQYEKHGGYDHAANDFDSLNPSNVKDINTNYGSGKTGKLPDDRTVTARPGSSDGRPTLEIRYPNGRGIEIRHGE